MRSPPTNGALRWLWLPCALSCSATAVDSALPPCASEDRAGALVSGSSVQGDDIRLEFLALQPEPVQVGENTWRVALSSDGIPLEGCSLNVQPSMPDHGHGAPTPAVEDLGGGMHSVSVQLTMGGYWETLWQISCSDIEDTLTVALCVDS